MRPALILLALVVPAAASAQTAPTTADPAQVAACVAPDKPVSARLPELFVALRAAESEAHSYPLEDAIWREWVVAPNPQAQTLLDDGMRRIRLSDFEGAERHFDRLIALCPGYAEGFNQRAYARFLQGRLDHSLEDIQEALMREPKHFAALSGRVRILFQQGRIGLAQQALAEAVEIHPWLRERRKLPLEPVENDT
ncbi:MAG: hypothetical protein AAF415_03010 [Pseudomonadota bacterium]